MRRDKRKWIDDMVEDAEDAASRGQMKKVYEATRKICGVRANKVEMIRSKDGRMLSKEEEIKSRWKQHFEEVLNRPAPVQTPEINVNVPEDEDIESGFVTKEEIKAAIRATQNGKSAGVDEVVVELLKSDLETAAKVLEKLYQRVWNEEEVPEDWKKGLIVKLPKKGNLTECGNWRGITLLVVVAKILGRIIVTRIKKGVDKKLRKEQAAFRSGRGTVEQIFILRNIIEQVVEWNANMYLCFVDFEKAFDSVHRCTLWKILRSYGVPTKLIQIIKALYTNSTCAVLDGGGRTDWFEVVSGVRQGCTMSGFLFLTVVDWVMRKTTEGPRNGIRWKLMDTLEDLDYADDIALLSSTKAQCQRKVNRLNKFAKETGLKINVKKTKTMRYNARSQEPIGIENNEVEEVENFTYLGACLDKEGGARGEIKTRIRKAWISFNKLMPIWKNNMYQRQTKLKIFRTNVLAVVMYGSETWGLGKGDERRLDVFFHKCLRRLMRISWREKVTNDEVREMAGIPKLSTAIRRRRWKWLGHVLRMRAGEDVKTALRWTPDSRRKAGRPRETWRRTVLREGAEVGCSTWAEMGAMATDRRAWRSLTDGPILQTERRT